MPILTDEHETTARFTDTGLLEAGSSHGVDWCLAQPAAAWSLQLLRDGKVFSAQACGAALLTFRPGQRLDCTWAAIARADGAGDVRAEVTVSWWLQAGLLHGSLAVRDLAPEWTLKAVVFPDVCLGHTDAADTRLVIPRETGWLLERAAAGLFEAPGAPGEFACDYAGMVHMQCLAWLNGRYGLYTDCRDPDGWIKSWRLTRGIPGTFRLQTCHLAPRRLAPPGSFALPYPITLGSFEGDWYDVARLYREWALTTPWARRGPEQRRRSFYGKLACWLWNRGHSSTVGPPARELARRIGAPVALDWYWWHQHPYDTEYPDYFPPREGTATFAAAVRDLQAANVFVQVYTNGMCYDRDGKAWAEAGPASALVEENGEYHAPAYNVFMHHRLADTCGASTAWRRIVLGLADQAAALGLDGLYLDMIAAVGGGRPCFHPDHGHAPGGGCYGVQGFRQTLREVRTAHPDWPLSSEATLECYMDLLDGYITPGLSLERIKWQADMYGGAAQPIPLFNAVYHGRCACFGNYSLLDGVPPFDDLWPQQFRTPAAAEKDWVALCPDQFAFEFARTVVFGNQPMVANLKAEHFADPRLQADLEFVVSLCRLYHAQREFLLWGDMLRPGAVACPEIRVRFLQRFIFTHPGEETYTERRYPAVLHSAWRAPDGRQGVLLVNYSREAAAVEYQPPPGTHTAALPAGLTDNNGAISGNLPARSALWLPLG